MLNNKTTCQYLGVGDALMGQSMLQYQWNKASKISPDYVVVHDNLLL